MNSILSNKIYRIIKVCVNHPTLLFFISIVCMALIFYIPYVFSLPPSSIHLWRQTDCLSITRHYYDNNLNFLDTQLFNFLFKSHTSAKTLGEFPIIYYFVAILWKLFGVKIWIFRLVSLVLFVGALFSIYKVIVDITHEIRWSLFVVLILYTSPVFVFYSVSFLPDIHAISFSMLAISSFYSYFKRNFLFHFYFAMVLFSIAGMIKPTALIPFCMLIGLFFMHLGKINRIKGIFKPNIHHLFGSLLVISTNVLWLFWVRHYNDLYGGWFTYNVIFPVWNYSSSELGQYAMQFRSFLVNQAFSRTVLYSLVVITILIYSTLRKTDKFVGYTLTLAIFGGGCYVILFFKWDVHDYYLLTLFIIPLLIFTIGIVQLKQINPNMLGSKAIGLVAFLLLAYNIWYCRSNMELRYCPSSEKTYLSTSSEPEVNNFKYSHWSYQQHFQALNEIEPYLISIGIAQEDKVISLPDETFGASLFLMNKKGWTGYGLQLTNEGINERIDKGAKYLIVNNMEELTNKGIPQVFLSNEIGRYKNVHVYKLR